MLTKEQIEKIQGEFKIPVDAIFYKDWIACLHPDSEIPTDSELRQIRSYIEFQICGFQEDAKNKIFAMPLPYSKWYHTDIFRKGHETGILEGWFRSKARYVVFTPNPAMDGYVPYTLEDLLDSILENFGQNWHIWKIAHPEIFPPK